MWTTILALLSKHKAAVFTGLLFIALLVSSNIYTHHTLNTSWQTRWDERDDQDKIATQNAKLAELQRAKDNVDAINKAREEAKAQFQQVQVDATTANASVARLQSQLAKLQSAGKGTQSTTAIGSQTAQANINVLADLLSKSLERNRQLANYADNSRVAGLLCEKSYDSLK